MKVITITEIPGVQAWRVAARDALKNGYHPDDLIWQTGQNDQETLFAPLGHVNVPAKKTEKRTKEPNIYISNQGFNEGLKGGASKVYKSSYNISKSTLALFEHALCHSDVKRFALCYRVLWRLVHEHKNLLQLKTDSDVMALTALVKAVRRDAYKMSAYLRFRAVDHNGTEHFVAWYEPYHYTLELKLNFFKTRFKNMHWSILTPYRAAHWDTNAITLEDNPDPAAYPQNDHIEQYWLTYYASTFNPARPKKGAMLTGMPKKYWKNMPETVLIDDLLKTSEARARAMIQKDK